MLQMPALDCGNKNGKRGGEGEEKEKYERKETDRVGGDIERRMRG